MRKLRNQDELFHYWAHAVMPEACCGNVSYRDGILFSYAQPIARILPDGTVLHHTGSWSVTTSAHQSSARMATRHLRRLYVPYLSRYEEEQEYFHTACRNRWEEKFEAAYTELRNHPRRKISVGRKLATLSLQWDAYRAHFKLDWPDVTTEQIKEWNAERERIAEARAAELERKRQQDILTEAADLAAWRVHQTERRSFTKTAIRLSKDGNEIETTLGARVPTSVAPMLWKTALHVRSRGKEVCLAERMSVGHYNLDRVGADGSLHIGCHTIPFDELELMAEKLGLLHLETA